MKKQIIITAGLVILALGIGILCKVNIKAKKNTEVKERTSQEEMLYQVSKKAKVNDENLYDDVSEILERTTGEDRCFGTYDGYRCNDFLSVILMNYESDKWRLTIMEKTIICIGREYGSGGHAIGKILAKRTGYEFYDKERFIAIAKERGFEGEVEEYLEEQPMNSLLYSIAMNYSRPKKKPFPFELVEELAAEKPCIIIGRCAGYLTREQDNAFSVFIHADMDKRIAAVMARDHINSRLKAKRKIEEIDEKRSTFRKEFTGEEWGQSKYYNLSIDTTHLSYQQAADLILYYKKLAEEAQK